MFCSAQVESSVFSLLSVLFYAQVGSGVFSMCSILLRSGAVCPQYVLLCSGREQCVINVFYSAQVGSSVFWSAAGTVLCWAGTWCRGHRRLLPTSSPSHNLYRTSHSMFYTTRFIIRSNNGKTCMCVVSLHVTCKNRSITISHVRDGNVNFVCHYSFASEF